MTLTVVVALVGLLAGGTIFWLVRKDRLHVNHAGGWLLVAVAFLFLGLVPDLVDSMASSLGISYPPTLAFTLAIVLLVIKLLVMDIERSQAKVQEQRLIQELAMLRGEIKRLKRDVRGVQEQEKP